MLNFTLLYPGFKSKCVTFSYDDGVVEDIKLIEILNKYHMKGTFNLNYGHSGDPKFRLDKDGKEIDCSHLVLEDYVSLYEKHEIANHTYNHPHLEDISYDEQYVEYKRGKEALEKVFQRKVYGAAYPYGSYNADTITVQKEQNVEYDRTVRSSYSFALPYDWLLWNPTIHHRDPEIWDYIKKFYESTQELALLYIWGHAYEFAIDHNFELMDDICKDLSSHEDVCNLTNHEVYEYVHAAARVYHRFEAFHNPSDLDVYLKIDGKNILVPARGEVPYGSK